MDRYVKKKTSTVSSNVYLYNCTFIIIRKKKVPEP